MSANVIPCFSASSCVLPNGDIVPFELKLLRHGDSVFFELRKLLKPLFHGRKDFSCKNLLDEHRGNFMVACRKLKSTWTEDSYARFFSFARVYLVMLQYVLFGLETGVAKVVISLHVWAKVLQPK